MTPLRRQRMWPVALAACLGGITLYITFVLNICCLSASLPISAMTLGIVVTGFIATQRNMLLTMSRAEVLRFAVRTKYDGDIMDYFNDGIRAGLLVTAVSVVGLFLHSGSIVYQVWLACFVFSVSLVVGLIIRNERLVSLLVLRYLRDTHGSRSETDDRDRN